MAVTAKFCANRSVGSTPTFASALVTLGEDPAYVMAQLGHTDAGFTLSVYARTMRRRDGERELLGAVWEGNVSTLADLERYRSRGGGGREAALPWAARRAPSAQAARNGRLG